MFLKHHFTFGSATPFISMLQMVTSRTKPHVDFKQPKYAPTFDIYLPHNDDKCCSAGKSQVVFKIMHARWDCFASLLNNKVQRTYELSMK